MLIKFLRFPQIRFLFSKIRYKLLKNKMRFYSNLENENIGAKTVKHNLSAFNFDAVFGCGGRMGLLIYPIISMFRYSKEIKTLIVGCRSEDDIFWMKSYGYHNTVGFDLFSYSKHVLTGDIHATEFSENSFDVVLLGWMISYSKNPQKVIDECVRITKSGGLIGIGVDYFQEQEVSGIPENSPRVNHLNSSANIIELFKNYSHKVIFDFNHEEKNDDAISVIVKVLK